MTHKISTLLAISFISVAFAPTAEVAHADPMVPATAQVTASTPVVDVEVDPIAYAFGGYSLHAGLRWNRFRLDLGAFALEVPGSFHGAKGLDVYAGGFGAKLDYYPLRRLPGLFAGVQLSRGRETVTAQATNEAHTATHTSVGARIGYRIALPKGFYALPWVGVDVSLTDRTQQVSGVEYKPGRAMFFPTVHLGKRF